jgi:cysteine sulfinate desulfinase/cysteine desulfurase-like protein
MHVNNEMGTILDRVKSLCKEHGDYHSDTVQSVGKTVADLQMHR